VRLAELEDEHRLLTRALEDDAASWLHLRAAGKDRTKLEADMNDLTARLRRLERKIRKEEKRDTNWVVALDLPGSKQRCNGCGAIVDKLYRPWGVVDLERMYCADCSVAQDPTYEGV
jgi:hypothetical protein